jgi:hypothetical protein
MRSIEPLYTFSRRGIRWCTTVVVGYLCVGLIAGCGLFTSGTGAGGAAEGDPETAGLAARAARLPLHGTEVVWEVPSEPVDGFIVRYGADPQHALREVKLPISSLREDRDPEYGPVYRYIIRSAPPTKLLYVSIAAFKGETVSEFSELVEEVR